jgi:hypothetical protein
MTAESQTGITRKLETSVREVVLLESVLTPNPFSCGTPSRKGDGIELILWLGRL